MTVDPDLILAREGGFVATDPITGTTSQGGTVAEALADLREAVELFREEFPIVPDFP